MSTEFTIIILCEIAILIFLVWGYMHEDKFIAWEDKMIEKIKKRGNK